MHTLICTLVDADGSEEALLAASTVFDRLTGHASSGRRIFDYCATLDEATTDYQERLDVPVAAPVEEPAGLRLLDRAWALTCRNFRQDLDHVQALLQRHEPAAIRRDEGRARRVLERCGARESTSVALYDDHGCGLADPERVAGVVASHDEPWIVPAVAHY